MIGTHRDSCEFLMESLPQAWRSAFGEAQDLAQRLAYLTWPDRARILDEFFWSRARSALAGDLVTAVVNRQAQVLAYPSPVARYTDLCCATLTAVLMMLDEPPRIGHVCHALTGLLSRREAHRDAAVEWIFEARDLPLQQELTRLPGYAFLILTSCPSDSAEAFMARDAFWAAMLGRG